MAARSRPEDLARKARFVFQGRVKRPGATMKEALAAGRTVIVTVDEVLQAPETLRHYAGKEVTVQLRPGQRVAAGQAAVFFTNPWLFGKSVAVQALAVQPPVKKARDAVQMGVERDPVRTLDERDARAHVESADVVVSGRVKSVRVPDAPRAVRGARGARGARAAAAGATLQRPSEHDPMWREAVVEVEDVHKGTHKRKTIIVRFPASRDIMWSEAPKLRPGQEGYFVLHAPPPAETPPPAPGRKGARAARPARAKAAARPQVYTVLHAGDFESFTRPQALQALIRASGTSDLS